MLLCTGGVKVSALCCHIEVLGSIPGRGKICIEYSFLVALAIHSAVVNRSGLYLVKGKVARVCLAVALLTPSTPMCTETMDAPPPLCMLFSMM